MKADHIFSFIREIPGNRELLEQDTPGHHQCVAVWVDISPDHVRHFRLTDATGVHRVTVPGCLLRPVIRGARLYSCFDFPEGLEPARLYGGLRATWEFSMAMQRYVQIVWHTMAGAGK